MNFSPFQTAGESFCFKLQAQLAKRFQSGVLRKEAAREEMRAWCEVGFIVELLVTA